MVPTKAPTAPAARFFPRPSAMKITSEKRNRAQPRGQPHEMPIRLARSKPQFFTRWSEVIEPM